MIFFNSFKNNRIKRSKYTEKVIESLGKNFENDNEMDDILLDNSKLETTLENISTMEEYLKEWFKKNQEKELDAFFDDELIRHLKNLHNFVSKYIPNYPSYYSYISDSNVSEDNLTGKNEENKENLDSTSSSENITGNDSTDKDNNFIKPNNNNDNNNSNNNNNNNINNNNDKNNNNLNSNIKDTIHKNKKIKVNPQAFFDSRDIIKNEMSMNVDLLINSENNVSGIVNDTKINFENGMSLDSYNNIYDANNDLIFNSKDNSQKIEYIDLLNKKVITENGIRVDLPKNFIEEFVTNNELISDSSKNRFEELNNQINKNKDKTVSDFNKELYERNDEIVGIINSIPIYKEDEKFIHLSTDELYTGDIFENDSEINFIEQIKTYKTLEDSFGTCNFKSIPYGELTFLLIFGGGKRGSKPLASNEISDKDITFKPDGTVYYSGQNSKFTTRRSGCPSSSYKTGHVMMWSETNPIGLKWSFLQFFYKLCSVIGIFNANIPPLVGFKKFKVFPGLCIGGLLEKIICSIQEKFSIRINELFQCIPTKLPSDSAYSGFENRLYPSGSSVDKIEDLDKIKSAKFGDRYVVDVVDTSITGLSKPSCCVFAFDPADKLKDSYKWKYKCWRGKPFVENNNNFIKKYDNESPYENPIIKDILLNTDALGTDSITKKLMSLQYAYLKKESLISIDDIENSINSTVENIVFEVIDKLTIDIARLLELKDFEYGKFQEYGTKIESRTFIDKYRKHFQLLTNSGRLKTIDLDKVRRFSKYSSNSNSSSNKHSDDSSYVEIEWYDFSSYDYKEYLVPDRKHIMFYDTIQFAEQMIPTQQLLDLYENNIKQLKTIGVSNSKYLNIKTIRDFINISGSKDKFDKDIKDNLNWIIAEMSYDGYVEPAFSQVQNRCNYTINNHKLF